MTQKLRCLFAALAIFLLALDCGTAAAADNQQPQAFDLLNPHDRQLDVDLENISGFVGPGSIVRVREGAREGTGLHFPELGINTVQLPSVDLTYWFNRLNALNFRFRYFDVTGTHFFTGPVMFNGSTIAPEQRLNSDTPAWYAFALYYERRLTPWYQDYEGPWPPALRGWETRAKIGIEYTYIDFRINGGHAAVAKTSKGEETKEDFFHQELPIPTIGLEALRRLNENFTFDASFRGNWINRWNSLRNEGGTVWLSQNGVEAHFQLLYTNPAWLGRFHPMAGFALYYYSQLEDSTEDGNFIRWFTYGPEYGVKCTF